MVVILAFLARMVRAIGVGDSNVEVTLLLYVSHCKEAGWSVSKMQQYMAVLAFGVKLRDIRDHTKSFLVSQVLKGWRRGRGSKTADLLSIVGGFGFQFGWFMLFAF